MMMMKKKKKKKKARMNCEPECRAFMNHESARSFSFFFSSPSSSSLTANVAHELDGYIRYTLVVSFLQLKDYFILTK